MLFSATSGRVLDIGQGQPEARMIDTAVKVIDLNGARFAATTSG